MTLPAQPKPLPLGYTELPAIADAVRDLHAYVLALPTIERVKFEGVVSFPVTLAVATRRPFYVALTGRPSPDNITPVVEVLGLTFTSEVTATGSTITIQSIDGVSAGDSVTLSGIVVGERA